jgi:hypothetical protein
MPQGDDLARPGIAARGKNGGFVGLRAAVGEKRLREAPLRRERSDLLRQSRLRRGGEDRGDVLEAVHLLVHARVHALVAVADADGDDAAEEIQVAVAVGVPHVLVLGAIDDERLRVVVED